MLLDIRQPVPLMIVAALHAAVLMLFQSGLHRPDFTPPETRQVVGYLVQPRIEPKPETRQPTPEPPKPPPQIEPEKVIEAPPKPVPPVKTKPKTPPKPKRTVKPKASKPSESAISTPPETPEPAPAIPDAAPTPAAPAAPPMPPAPPAPPAPAPVAAPRFDAAYLNNPAPAYPPLSRRMGEEGKVLLRVHVGPDGRPMEVRLHASSGFARLDDSAQEAVRNWRFVPATQAGVPVAAWVLVPIGYGLDD